MKQLALLFFCLLSSAAFAGPVSSGKEMKNITEKEVAPCPCDEWYANNEWNVSIWGAYAFTAENWENDRYLNADHAWGGGVDVKYFFLRYFGIGIEGFVLDAKRRTIDENGVIAIPPPGTHAISIPGFTSKTGEENRAIGAALGTFTFRYPLPCPCNAPWVARFAPYFWVGGGAIFNGGEHDKVHVTEFNDGFDDFAFRTTHTGTETKAIGQFGGGIEYRFTHRIGWMNDFSWNVIDGSHNNFGMVRSGLTFAF